MRLETSVCGYCMNGVIGPDGKYPQMVIPNAVSKMAVPGGQTGAKTNMEND